MLTRPASADAGHDRTRSSPPRAEVARTPVPSVRACLLHSAAGIHLPTDEEEEQQHYEPEAASARRLRPVQGRLRPRRPRRRRWRRTRRNGNRSQVGHTAAAAVRRKGVGDPTRFGAEADRGEAVVRNVGRKELSAAVVPMTRSAPRVVLRERRGLPSVAVEAAVDTLAGAWALPTLGAEERKAGFAPKGRSRTRCQNQRSGVQSPPPPEASRHRLEADRGAEEARRDLAVSGRGAASRTRHRNRGGLLRPKTGSVRGSLLA